MAKIYNSITELVGHTPIVEFHRLGEALNLKGRIAGKLEYFNPAGSHKDRIALEIIEQAELRGDISPDKTTLIEFTSGNTGIALAAFAAAKGYKFKIGLQPGVSEERLKLLEAYQAEIVPIIGELGDLLAKVNEKGFGAFEELVQYLVKETPNGWATEQLSNPDNINAHYKHTGPEIWEDTDGKIDVFIGGVGTGGSTHGTSKYLKEKNPDVKIVAVEPAGSPVLSKGTAGAHKIQGIGAGFVPDVLNTEIYDEIITIENEDAFTEGRAFAQSEGILVGISSGAALKAATILANRPENKGKTIVALLPDSGDRYLSTPLFSN